MSRDRDPKITNDNRLNLADLLDDHSSFRKFFSTYEKYFSI